MCCWVEFYVATNCRKVEEVSDELCLFLLELNRIFQLLFTFCVLVSSRLWNKIVTKISNLNPARDTATTSSTSSTISLLLSRKKVSNVTEFPGPKRDPLLFSEQKSLKREFCVFRTGTSSNKWYENQFYLFRLLPSSQDIFVAPGNCEDDVISLRISSDGGRHILIKFLNSKVSHVVHIPHMTIGHQHNKAQSIQPQDLRSIWVVILKLSIGTRGRPRTSSR